MKSYIYVKILSFSGEILLFAEYNRTVVHFKFHSKDFFRNSKKNK
jgi:hypothetical protein